MSDIALIWGILNPLERIGLVAIVTFGLATYIGWVEFAAWLDARFRR